MQNKNIKDLYKVIRTSIATNKQMNRVGVLLIVREGNWRFPDFIERVSGQIIYVSKEDKIF